MRALGLRDVIDRQRRRLIAAMTPRSIGIIRFVIVNSPPQPWGRDPRPPTSNRGKPPAPPLRYAAVDAGHGERQKRNHRFPMLDRQRVLAAQEETWIVRRVRIGRLVEIPDDGVGQSWRFERYLERLLAKTG